MTIAKTLLEVGAFIALMLIVGRGHSLAALAGGRHRFAWNCSPWPSFRLAIGIAFGAAKLFSVSFALGAFFAGMVMRESEFSHRAAEESLPLRDAFSVLFFVSVGMLFPAGHPARQAAAGARRGRHHHGRQDPGCTGHRAGLPLSAQHGADGGGQPGPDRRVFLHPRRLGRALGLMSVEAMNYVLAGALFSIALNPLMFSVIDPLRRWALNNSAFARELEQRGDPYAELPMTTERKYLEKQVVLVGYGRVATHRRGPEQPGNSLRRGRTESRAGRAPARTRHPLRIGRRRRPSVLIQAISPMPTPWSSPCPTRSKSARWSTLPAP